MKLYAASEHEMPLIEKESKLLDSLQKESFYIKGHWRAVLYGPDGDVSGPSIIDPVTQKRAYFKESREKNNTICQVGKNQILLYTAAEYLNQFKYTAIGTNSLTVTGATNASPIVITVSLAYGLYNGQQVTISGVGGNTAANTTCYAKTSGYTSTTFALYSDSGLTTPIAGNGAYTSGGTVTIATNSADIALLYQLAISTAITPTNPSSGVLQFQYTFAAGTGTGAVAECGEFDASSSGNIISHITFAVINKGAGDSLQLTYQFS